MQQTKKQAFTLVELIVVITIIAILGTIAFISLQGYSSQARDSKRLSDIQNIKKSLELFSLNSGKYPEPDEFVTVSYDTQDLWYQGTIGDQVTTNLSRNLNNKPLDPLTETPYTYSRTYKGNEYELLSIYESDLVSQNTKILNQTQAEEQDYPKIDGTYNGVYVKAGTTYLPTPSIINALGIDIDLSQSLNELALESQIITGGENNIANAGIDAKTGGLANMSIQVFSGTLDKVGENTGSKTDLLEKLQLAYINTSLANEGIYKKIIDTQLIDTGSIISLIDDLFLDTNIYISSTTSNNDGNDLGDDTPTITDWRDQDPNCEIADIHVPEGCIEGTDLCQIWAGCNSTLGDGIEYTNETNCYNYDKDGNGIIDNLGACGAGNLGDSNDNALDYYNSLAGTINQNNDLEVDNIWGKLYTWYKSGETDGVNLDNNGDSTISEEEDDEVCPGGYHIPSDSELATLEQLLGCDSLEASRTTRGCDGQGWKYHTTTNSGTSIAEILKMPLSGNLNSDGSTFNRRGRTMYLWSSTSSDVIAYRRDLDWNDSKVLRYNSSKEYGFSVRCLKD